MASLLLRSVHILYVYVFSIPALFHTRSFPETRFNLLTLLHIQQDSKMIHNIATKEEFNEKVTNRSDDKCVMVDFWARWCGPCRKIGPVLEKIAIENPGIEVYKVNVDSNSETAQANDVLALPTFKLFKNGQCLETFKGSNESNLRKILAQNDFRC